MRIVQSAVALVLLSAAVLPAPAAEGVRLLGGKNLAGWTSFLRDARAKMQDVWDVKDGVLHCQGRPAGYLRTEKKYTSYVLKLEWRFPGPRAGNSGVLLRVVGPDRVWPKSIEAQLMHRNAGDIWKIGGFPMKVDPDRTKGRRTVKVHESNEKPVGEWNQYEITLKGKDLELKVNGLVQNTASEVEVVPGYIALQSEGVPIEFRNITVEPLE